MKTLTREEIQALSDDELNEKLMNLNDVFVTSFQDQKGRKIVTMYRAQNKGSGYSFTSDTKSHLLTDYCNSLDTQFKLAEKMDLTLRIERVHIHNPEICKFYDVTVWINNNGINRQGNTKRTGAELLLEAIQELEKNK